MAVDIQRLFSWSFASWSVSTYDWCPGIITRINQDPFMAMLNFSPTIPMNPADWNLCSHWNLATSIRGTLTIPQEYQGPVGQGPIEVP